MQHGAAIAWHWPDRTGTVLSRQRLIYTGKVLKDEETLANYKLQNNRE